MICHANDEDDENAGRHYHVDRIIRVCTVADAHTNSHIRRYARYIIMYKYTREYFQIWRNVLLLECGVHSETTALKQANNGDFDDYLNCCSFCANV